MKEKFVFFGPATLVYALVYVFCTYNNPSGITFPVFIAASLAYLCLALAKLEINLKKENLFYLVSMMLLGVSTFCTDDGRIIMMNKTGIFVLMMVLLLGQFFDTSDWQLGKYLKNMLGLMFGSLGEVGAPVRDGLAYCKENNKVLNNKIVSVLVGLAAAIPLLFIVLLLLGSADAVFREIANVILTEIRIGEAFGDVINILFRILVFFVLVYAWLAYLSKGKQTGEEKEKKKGEPVIAITVTGLLSAVYLLFCGIQVVYLFFGKMSLPEGYTYAGYAREGFFQLLAVSVMNLVIVLFVLSCFSESKVLKVILTIMSLCTFIMIISSALRMIIYIRYYYLTFLRVFVLWALAVLFVLFIGVIRNIYKSGFPLFQYGMTVITVFYLLLSFSHPDYYIAKINISNAAADRIVIDEYSEEWEPREGDFFQTRYPYQDYEYLASMSADAAPVLIPYLAGLGCDISAFYEENVFGDLPEGGYMSAYRQKMNQFGYYYLEDMKYATKDFSWRTYNISRHMMLNQIEKYSK